MHQYSFMWLYNGDTSLLFYVILWRSCINISLVIQYRRYFNISLCDPVTEIHQYYCMWPYNIYHQYSFMWHNYGYHQYFLMRSYNGDTSIFCYVILLQRYINTTVCGCITYINNTPLCGPIVEIFHCSFMWSYNRDTSILLYVIL